MTRRLPLRARLALLTAAAVAVAVAACAVAAWFLTRDQLYRQLDRSLADPGPGPGLVRPGPPPQDPADDPIEQALRDCHPDAAQAARNGRTGQFRLTFQVITAGGRRCVARGSAELVVTAADRQVAAGGRTRAFHDGVTGDGTAMRILTRADPHRRGVAVSTAQPLGETTRTLDNLAILLVAVAAVGVVGAATAGLVIARAALRPVDRLTEAVEHIASTEDLHTKIPDEGADEIARLGRSFNTMTAALATSRDRQRQLIADAGHELRTPLTSLRTNIDLLIRSAETGRQLPEGARSRLLGSLKAQMYELSSLVGDLLALSGPGGHRPREVVALHEVVGKAVERARLRGRGLAITLNARPWYVRGDAGSLERAVVNLLDNAVKFSPPGGSVQVRLQDGELTVRDHGPGVPDDERPHVFDRFWRSPSARSLPGSGLGLSIVALVARESGGQVAVEAADGGGTLARMRLPGTPDPPEPPEPA